MRLVLGARLGPYEVLVPLGAGGMGEVYRARDTKLDRVVALKVLPDTFATDPDRLARFQREAKTLATLNHPNIGSIHGLEEADGATALVMELVEGEDLAERIARGPIPVNEALAIARQIADALEAAHENGIIHRDLKPANIKVRADGAAKVLDFGLAKTTAAVGQSSQSVSLSPTITSPAMTAAGVILGTAAYMAPEQAKGRAADKRSDVWAFGCVLYEMLTGRRAFAGDDVSDTLAFVLTREPDWNLLPAAVPPAIRTLLRRCLTKDRKRRLDSAADARLEIEDALTAATTETPSARPGGAGETRRAARLERLTWLLIALGLIATITWLLVQAPAETGPVRVTLTVPPGVTLQGSGGDRLLAISPDGRRIAFVAAVGGKTQIYLRHADQFDPVPVVGTEGGVDPFFSPDGQWLGFMAGAVPGGGVIPVQEGKLKKVPIGGGPATTLGDATNRGASWGVDNTIVFATTATGGLWRVPASGGTPQQLTTLAATERSHRWPSFLPGGKAVLFSIQPGGASFDDALIAVRTLDTGEQRVVAQGGASPVYVPTGHILFGRAGALMAIPFDLQRLEVTGPPVAVLEGVSMNTGTGGSQFATAAGSLVYIPGAVSESRREILWVDRRGVSRPLGADKRPYNDLALSPDGRRIAMAVASVTGDIWLYEIARGNMRRLTFSPGLDVAPIWMPDGAHVTFNGIRNGVMQILQTGVDDGGREEQVINAGAANAQARSWHPSGNWLAYDTGDDIYILSSTGDRQPAPLVATQFTESFPAFSPDGRWIAYQSNESGSFDIYVKRFPESGGKSQVSNAGGVRPKWSRDGRELFFRSGDRMMAVTIEPAATFTAGSPRVLFEGRYAPGYDVAADGRFLMVREEQPADMAQLRFVLRWWHDLERLRLTEAR